MAKTKVLHIPFMRPDGSLDATMSMIRMEVTNYKDTETSIEALKECITSWIKGTKEGREAWEYSCSDFNIGDLASYEDVFKEYAKDLLPHHGIQKFEIIELEEARSYDKILANCGELED